MDASIWLQHISLLLQGAVAIAKVGERTEIPLRSSSPITFFHLLKTISESKEPVAAVIHCSDGWDRTTQLLSLAELLLDPTYRTHHGFETLVEKDWLSFGHKFAERTGKTPHLCSSSLFLLLEGSSFVFSAQIFFLISFSLEGHTYQPNKEKERSPIFLQFIECVWQIWNQFPTAFTFNERFLLVILENVYSCRYGTFLCDSEKERTDTEVLEGIEILYPYLSLSFSLISIPQTIFFPSRYFQKGTQSLWTYIHTNIGGFFNHDYQSSASELILDPKTDKADLAFWTSYYQAKMLMTKGIM
jgi:hypothetical protein